jgi:hypothetical protein
VHGLIPLQEFDITDCLDWLIDNAIILQHPAISVGRNSPDPLLQERRSLGADCSKFNKVILESNVNHYVRLSMESDW